MANCAKIKSIILLAVVSDELGTAVVSAKGLLMRPSVGVAVVTPTYLAKLETTKGQLASAN